MSCHTWISGSRRAGGACSLPMGSPVAAPEHRSALKSSAAWVNPTGHIIWLPITKWRTLFPFVLLARNFAQFQVVKASPWRHDWVAAALMTRSPVCLHYGHKRMLIRPSPIFGQCPRRGNLNGIASLTVNLETARYSTYLNRFIFLIVEAAIRVSVVDLASAADRGLVSLAKYNNISGLIFINIL